jgi:hypothetical protein
VNLYKIFVHIMSSFVLPRLFVKIIFLSAILFLFFFLPGKCTHFTALVVVTEDYCLVDVTLHSPVDMYQH